MSGILESKTIDRIVKIIVTIVKIIVTIKTYRSVEITNSELQGEWLRQYVVYVITVHTHPDRSK